MDRIAELYDASIDVENALTELQETSLWPDLPLDVRKALCHARAICLAIQTGIDQAEDS